MELSKQRLLVNRFMKLNRAGFEELEAPGTFLLEVHGCSLQFSSGAKRLFLNSELKKIYLMQQYSAILNKK